MNRSIKKLVLIGNLLIISVFVLLLFYMIDLNTKKYNKINANFNSTKLTTITTTTETTTTTTITTAKLPDKVISFTFDDGPSKYSIEIANILEEYNANATFFQVGYMIENKKEIVLELFNRGFEIGNHTYDHSNLNKLSALKVQEKISKNNILYNGITNSNMMLLRPPYGSCNQKTKEQISIPIIKWSVDSRDWESRNTTQIVNVVKKNTKDGDIVLFHDLYATTLEAIKLLVPYFYEEGYEIVSVSELFQIKNIPLENGKIYNSAN